MYKKLLAAICASAMVLAACTACGGSSSSDSESSKENTKTSSSEPDRNNNAEETDAPEESADSPAEGTAAPDSNSEFEEPVVAGSGDAILAITDGQWYVQYWGNAEDILAYDAGIAHIDGDGDYTVSVNIGTKGAQFDVAGDPNGDYKCSGVSFAAVKVLDGTTLYPNMNIEIKEIRVDGNPIELTAKNYTSSDDNVEMRANILNSYVSSFPDDAHTPAGKPTGEFGEYSAQIINPDDVASWSKIEVDFTVSGISGAAEAPADTPADAPAETEVPAEVAPAE